MNPAFGDSYELRAGAFEAAPDPRFYFPSLTQRKAMSAVSYALNRGAGVVALTGPHGLGKTLLLERLAQQVIGQPVTLARLAGGGGALASRTAEAFGLEQPTEHSYALAALDAFLLEESRRGQRALLLLDDGEALSDEAADDIAALAGLHHGERNLLQIVLVGDDGFARRLDQDPEWSTVRGHTIATHIFEPLLRDEVEPYLRHRLLCADWQGEPELDPGLAPLLHEATGGVPAAINQAMSALIADALESGAATIDGAALAAWLDYGASSTAPEPIEIVTEPASHAAPTLAEAQIDAIEAAFAEHDRALAKLRGELAELRNRDEDRPAPAPTPHEAQADVEERLEAIEARLDQHEEALRRMLERLIMYFERAGAD